MQYRVAADVEAFGIIAEKSAETHLSLPLDYGVTLQPGSRLFDPTCPDHPILPCATPQLYTYDLPNQRQQPASETEAESLDGDDEVRITKIPAASWEAVSEKCLDRMLEFQSVRQEYLRTFDTAAEPGQDDTPRLTLEEIVQYGLLNSRDYQTQKELLYRVALRLSLERFDYALKFSPFATGTGIFYTHDRTAGITTDTLAVPTATAVDKVLATGGTFVGRFANDVLLTFNGPDGFTADVTSALLFELSQSIFQRDIVFERLTQAERDVVYQARTFAQFRQQIFLDFASDYYTLLRTYRQIEIDSQNYFTLVRALDQAEAELETGFVGRIQVEQIEQNMLQGRSRLIQTCNNLESSLDRLKIRMGLPTETPLDLNLGELEALTLRDELAVAAERVSRGRRRLEAERNKPLPRRAAMLNAASTLTERMLESTKLVERMDEELLDREFPHELVVELATDAARLDVEVARVALAKQRATVPPAPPLRLFQRIMDLVRADLVLAANQLDIQNRLPVQAIPVELQERYSALEQRAADLQDRMEAALVSGRLDQLAGLVASAAKLQEETEALCKAADRAMGNESGQYDEAVATQRTLEQVDQLLEETTALLEAAKGVLVPVEIAIDDAMLTALAERLDLMNERGTLADERRRVKLAADDLKSVLNLNARQTIGTHKNRPFDFTFDESRTELSATLDLPFNRKAQRNLYREQLLDYQFQRRNLMASEDNIKLAVRDDLRALELAKDQYQISVASAALAFDRVRSTRLEFELGFQGVAARDFLEAQDAYILALSSVADNHLGHIVNRAQLFFDLGLMDLGETGFWDEIRDGEYQPTASSDLSPWTPAYGRLAPKLKYSHTLLRAMERCYTDQVDELVPNGYQEEEPAKELPAPALGRTRRRDFKRVRPTAAKLP